MSIARFLVRGDNPRKITAFHFAVYQDMDLLWRDKKSACYNCAEYDLQTAKDTAEAHNLELDVLDIGEFIRRRGDYEPQMQAVLEAFADGQPFTRGDVVLATGAKRPWRLLRKMRDDGLIVARGRTRATRYYVTPPHPENDEEGE